MIRTEDRDIGSASSWLRLSETDRAAAALPQRMYCVSFRCSVCLTGTTVRPANYGPYSSSGCSGPLDFHIAACSSGATHSRRPGKAPRTAALANSSP